jgi:hypothetical protein
MNQHHDHVDPYRCYFTDVQNNPVDGLALYYPPNESKRIMEELQMLLNRYRTDFVLAGIHASPSPTWRDERASDVRHRSSCRFATRVHLYEKAAAARTDLSGGRYLGFVCLRPPDSDGWSKVHPGFQYVIEAELGRPKHMFRPRYHIIQTTTSAPRLGVLPFLSTVFMSPRPEVKSSTCVHLAISQALHLIMGRFGSKPISQREFETYLWRSKGSLPIETVAERGATLKEALTIVREHCGGGGFIVDISSGISTVDAQEEKKRIWREAHRVITDCLANGLPIIMMVEHTKLIPTPEGRRPPNESPLQHAALVFGMRLLNSGQELGACALNEETDLREDHAELPGIFVGHDSIQGPFMEWTAKHLLTAAYECCPFDNAARAESPGIRFLVLGPKDLNIGLHQVSYQAQSITKLEAEVNKELYERYYDAYADQKRLPAKEHRGKPVQWRYVTRLLSLQEVIKSYLDQKDQDALTQLAEKFKAPHEKTEEFRNRMAQAGYCWVVEVHLPAYKDSPEECLRNKPLIIYLWSIADEYKKVSSPQNSRHKANQSRGGAPRATLVFQMATNRYSVQ